MDRGIDIDTSQWWLSPGTRSYWEQVRAAKFDFAYIRFTDGVGFVPRTVYTVLEYGKQGRDAGLQLGLIHVFDPRVNGAQQADTFSTLARKIVRNPNNPITGGKHQVILYFNQQPAIWLEKSGDPTLVQENLYLLLKAWDTLQLPKPRLAMSNEYFDNHRLDQFPGLEKYDLWIIDPTKDPAKGEKPTWPALWAKEPKLWQTSARSLVNGAVVGINYALKGAIEKEKPPPPQNDVVSPILKGVSFLPLLMIGGVWLLIREAKKAPGSKPKPTGFAADQVRRLREQYDLSE